MTQGFVPPPYPYDRLTRLAPIAAAHDGGAIDLSIGTPCDPAPDSVVDALANSGTEHSYPPSVGTPAFREAASRWFERRLGADIPVEQIAATIGSKEFVAGLPHWMRLRNPDRDTVLFPSVSYPSYEMGATLAGCRAVPVAPTATGALDLDSIDPADASRALLIWSNSPNNPTGHHDDLAAVAAWGRAHDVPVFSDECYVEFTWDGPPRSIVALDRERPLDGVVAVHSLSKRSNLAGVRVGFYAGDADLVHYLSEVRKHAGMMVPGPAQAAAIAALDDDEHVRVQRERYQQRLTSVAAELGRWADVEVPLPAGGFYLWVPAADGWDFTERLAADGGALVSPGEFYGEHGASFVRVAVVQPDDRIALLANRLRSAR